MVRRSKALLLGLVAAGVLAMLPTLARADFSTSAPPATSWSNFESAFSVTAAPALTGTYAMSNRGTTPENGKVVSEVFYDPSNGLYAYVYQVQVASGDVNTDVVSPWNSSFASATLKNTSNKNVSSPVFQITSGAAPAGFASTNLVGAISISGDSTPPGQFTATWSKSALKTGKNSFSIVVFSPLPPTVEQLSSITDGSSANVLPNVYAPAPEPPAYALCGIGILGLFGAAAYRRFRPRPSLA